MATDDPRLNKLISQGDSGDIVIVGCPYDFLRKRQINKGGEDNGACCLRRFYAKVGPLFNPQYQIDIGQLKVTDMGNVNTQTSKEEQDQQFKNVATKKFKGEFVNYYKHSPQKIIQKISQTVVTLVENNKLPFIFGGSKEGMMASIDAFHSTQKDDSNKVIYILSSRPFLERPYDGDKATSNNISSILSMKYPQTSVKVFGAHLQYFPQSYLNIKNQKISINSNKVVNFEFITYDKIRNIEVSNSALKLGNRTQGLNKFKQIYKENCLSQVHISLQVLQLFRGCRDISLQGLQEDQLMQIMMFLGRQKLLKAISINQFNPSCEDYESSLIILNALYYFLLGRAQKVKANH